MKKILPILLLVSACAYQPNIPPAQQERANYSTDLTACTDDWQKEMDDMLGGPLGTVSYLYARSQATPEQLAKFDHDVTYNGKREMIDTCMKQKGYTVQK